MNYQQFKMNIDKQPNGCEVWKNMKGSGGFPQWQVVANNHHSHRMGQKRVSARRQIWQLFNETVPADKTVHMTCTTRSCVNPSHMILVDGEAWSLTGPKKK